ncbi:MAG: dTDP-4-dehydrorhamnose reductase [Thiohalomonadaceae bacterium]
MKVLVCGAGGQLGRMLCATAPGHVQLAARNSAQLDVSDLTEVAREVAALRPAVIINAAAYTAVDRAEQEPEHAHAVNARGPAHLAQAATQCGARLFHVSTDYVFDGTSSRPYRPLDACHPLGVYGTSKRAGEETVLAMASQGLIVRTSWLYAAQGNNFVHTMLRLMRERSELGVVADQIGSPTWAGTLAAALWAAVQRPRLHGIYHWADLGVASWYDFAVAIQEEALAAGLLTRAIPLRPLRSEEYPTPARRPAYSVLDTSDARRDFELAGVHWRAALRMMLQELSNDA